MTEIFRMALQHRSSPRLTGPRISGGRTRELACGTAAHLRREMYTSIE